ncbi:GH24681 [Drosophila grimshawi]|uniref:GH24681 n=1 Tax=Drosophila grimshawi TaxID=7222 RepID=B4JMS1_DROGR|nr:GH24681 [Drosophila grimshawi]
MSSEATPHIPAVATPIEFGSIMFIQLAKLAKDVSRDLRSVHQEARSEEERYGVAWRRVGEAASSSFRVNAAQDEPQDACVLTDFIKFLHAGAGDAAKEGRDNDQDEEEEEDEEGDED